MESRAAKRVYIRTFGCQMNVHDSERMEEVLAAHGYLRADSPGEADLIIVNTCSVREKSHEKVLSTLDRLSRHKHGPRQPLLAVAGCVAQQEGSHLLEAVPAVDLVFSPDHIARLPQLLEEAASRRMAQTGFTEIESYRFLAAAPDASRCNPLALVTIQKGCDNACAYCIVPQVRGPAISRPAVEVLAEIRTLTGAGVREVTLIGQNVNAYRGGSGTSRDFVDLLEQVDEVSGLERVRFTTSHPKDFHDDLPGCFGSLKSLCPWLHLPVQSGSSRVLELMHRGYTREQYLARITQVRAACPDISLGTDLIVGFPSETEADFLQTIELLEEIRFDYAYSFKFSVRPGTPAAQLPDDVPEEEKLRRLYHVQAVQDRITQERLERWVGRSTRVLVEGPSRKGLPQLQGRTGGNHVVNFAGGDSPPAAGAFVDVLITRAGRHSLSGEVHRAAISREIPASC